MAGDRFIPGSKIAGSKVSGLRNQGEPSFSPLVLADRLIGLAKQADREGYGQTASALVGLVYSVLDTDLPRPRANRRSRPGRSVRPRGSAPFGEPAGEAGEFRGAYRLRGRPS